MHRPCSERQLGLIVIRGRLLQMRQDLRDDFRLLDAGDDFELPAATRAALDLDAKDALQALGPRHGHMARGGLARSARSDIYAQVLEVEIGNPKSLNSLARHFRYGDVVNPAFVTRVLKSAIDADSPASVIECLLFAVQHYGTDKIADSDSFLRDALNYLNTCQDARWIHEGW